MSEGLSDSRARPGLQVCGPRKLFESLLLRSPRLACYPELCLRLSPVQNTNKTSRITHYCPLHSSWQIAGARCPLSCHLAGSVRGGTGASSLGEEKSGKFRAWGLNWGRQTTESSGRC